MTPIQLFRMKNPNLGGVVRDMVDITVPPAVAGTVDAAVEMPTKVYRTGAGVFMAERQGNGTDAIVPIGRLSPEAPWCLLEAYRAHSGSVDANNHLITVLPRFPYFGTRSRAGTSTNYHHRGFMIV